MFARRVVAGGHEDKPSSAPVEGNSESTCDLHQLFEFASQQEVELQKCLCLALKLDTLGIEPRAFRMRSGCDTTTPCALEDLRQRKSHHRALAAIPNSKTCAEQWASIRVQASGLPAHGVALGRAISFDLVLAAVRFYWRCTSKKKCFPSVLQRWQAGWQAGWGRDEGQTCLGTRAFLKISCEASCCLGVLRGGLGGTQGTITARPGGKWVAQRRFISR